MTQRALHNLQVLLPQCICLCLCHYDQLLFKLHRKVLIEGNASSVLRLRNRVVLVYNVGQALQRGFGVPVLLRILDRGPMDVEAAVLFNHPL